MGEYLEQQPSRDEIDALARPAVVAFGTNWCGYCLGAERHIKPALAEHPELPVIWAEDGPGRPLGRSFRVKLWPTLVFMKDGQEVHRLVRPQGQQEIEQALRQLAQSV